MNNLIRSNAGWMALFALGCVAPFVLYPTFLMQVLCFALFASAFNLLLGFAGLLSFGHAAFFGGAAYVCAALSKNYGVTPELSVLAGGAFAALLGLGFGALSIRRAGIYMTMITLALAQLVFFFAVQLSFTGGEDGLQGVPRGKLFGLVDLTDNIPMYFFVFAVFCLGFWLIYRTVHSPFGQVLTSIRENEARAISLGYDVEHFKLVAFVLSAALAGLAGATKTVVLGFATLSDAVWTTSGAVILMTLVGGMGTMVGPIVGALIVIALENKIGDLGKALAETTGIGWFNGLGESVNLVTGLIFILCVLAFRRGVVGEILHRLPGRR